MWKPSMILRATVAAATCGWMLAVAARQPLLGQAGPPDAPVGQGGQTNGMLSQSEFDAARVAFEARETPETGLGPVFNAPSCVACHRNPATGGGSQVTVLRAGTNGLPN